MPLLGCHMSIAGGFHRALLAARKYGCDTVQLFVSPPKNWPVSSVPATHGNQGDADAWMARPMPDDAVRLFRQTLRQAKLRSPMAHDSYLINLASPEEKLFRRSVEAFVEEVRRAEKLGLRYLVTHPGACLEAGEAFGLARVAQALDEVHRRCPGFRVQILLETTAGQGSTLGHRFEHLARILALVEEPRRLGVCFDTCHVFAAGYALWPEAEYRATLRAFDRVIGLKRLKAFHLNDSKKPRGSRVDRHEHIGQGELGPGPFRLLLNEPRFRRHPMVLETPKEDDEGRDMDAVNLAVVRGLMHATTREP